MFIQRSVRWRGVFGLKRGAVGAACRPVVVEGLEARRLLSGTEGVVDGGAEVWSSLAGYVYDDANDNGVVDPGEPGVAGVVVTLTGSDDAGNDVWLERTTGADGAFVFTGLRSGVYAVEETQPAGYVDGQDSVGSAGGFVFDDHVSFFVLQAGVDAVGYNFGEMPLPSSVSGVVYHDADGDGARGGGEVALAGMTVTVSGTDNLGQAVSRVGVTDGAGFYSVGDLRPGNYTVTMGAAVGYLAAGGNRSVDLAAGVDVGGYDGAYILPASIAGRVYVDANGNALAEAEEAGVGGVTVRLHDGAGNVLATVATDGGGYYVFEGLYPGTYWVSEVQPSDYNDGPEGVGSHGGDGSVNDVVSGIVLRAGEAGTGYVFAERPVPVTAPVVPASWHSKDAQELIRVVGETPTSLGNWLAGMFPNLYGATAGANRFGGRDRAYVADRYLALRKGSTKLEAEMLGLALTIFCTTSTLNSTAAGQALAAEMALSVTPPGNAGNLANVMVNVGNRGRAFGVADGSTQTVMRLLRGLDGGAERGTLFGGEPKKVVKQLEKMVEEVFDGLGGESVR